jgi:hypothetical protein
MDTFSDPTEPQIFYCEKCNVKCCKKSKFEKHLATANHKRIHFGYILDTFGGPPGPISVDDNKKHKCECGKDYKYSQGLSKHKKSCTISIIANEKTEPTDKELIMMLIKENSELKNMVLEVCQKIQPLSTINNYNNSNSHNKTFNLNVFLNETCKDAMNINDFVDSLKLQLCDLESVGKLGYIDGISSIIVQNLNSLDETERPIHCTDTKRETVYIKDENKWEKEGQDNKKLKKAIKRIAHKNSKLLYDFRELHPDCNKSESKYSDQYNKLIIEAMGGLGNNDIDKEGKIIKKILKNVTINKHNYVD